MIFLSKETAHSLTQEEAQSEALKYSNLCKANLEIISIQENQIKRLAQELGEKNQIVLDAQAHLGQLKNLIFGTSSEKRKGESGLPLFDPVAEKTKTVTYEKKKREKFGRTEQPALPRIEVFHELSVEEITAHQLTKMEGAFESSEMINVIPAKFVVEEHKRQKYLGPVADATRDDPDSREIVTAPGPLKLKDAGRYTIEFGVDVGLSKYQWHLPLDRQVRIMKSFGLECTSQVLFAQIDTVAWYLENNVMPGIQKAIRESRVNLGDETFWENLEKDAKKRFWLWVVMNPKAVLFDVFDSRSKAAGKLFLTGLQGVLLTDGYPVYACLRCESLKLANDWSHVRRKMIQAEKTHPEESKFFVDCIRELFEIEKQALLLSNQERLEIRKKESQPWIDQIYQKLIALKNTLPRSPLGKAIHYTLKLWNGLTVFLENGEVPLHTNSVERVIRGPVIGRKNHYGSKTIKSAKMAAIWYSVIHTCEANGISPRDYITDTLKRILTKKPVLMPWEWKLQVPSMDSS